MVAAHASVCSPAYCPSEGGMASSRWGSGKSARSMRSYSAAVRVLAFASTQSATALPRRPGRVLPRMMAIFNSLKAAPADDHLNFHVDRIGHDMKVQVRLGYGGGHPRTRAGHRDRVARSCGAGGVEGADAHAR